MKDKLCLCSRRTLDGLETQNRNFIAEIYLYFFFWNVLPEKNLLEGEDAIGIPPAV